jgi:ribosomal protein L13
MLPKTKMGEAMWRKLKVYADAAHPHQAQKPRPAGRAATDGEGKPVRKSSKREVA